MKKIVLLFVTLFSVVGDCVADSIPQSVMQRIYQEVRTPYKYGMVVAPTDNYHKIDCPTVFRKDGRWLMTYVVYNGKDGTGRPRLRDMAGGERRPAALADAGTTLELPCRHDALGCQPAGRLSGPHRLDMGWQLWHL